MAKYGEYDTLDELIASYKPMMEEDKEKQEKRKDNGRRKRNYDTEDDMMLLLYALEHMDDGELEQLEKQCTEDLEEIKKYKERNNINNTKK